MDTGFNTDISTTNREDYRSESECFLPPIKYHQVPCIQLKEAPKLPPRNFPIEPLGPNRHWEKFDHNVLPNITPFTDKPIVRALPPNQVVNKSQSSKVKRKAGPPSSDPGPFREDEEGYTTEETPGEVIEKLCHSLRWSTSTKKATEEACLPTPKVDPPNTTLEDNADVVMLRPKRFESRPAPWQRVYPVWDRLQIRPHVGEIVGKVGAREQRPAQGTKETSGYMQFRRQRKQEADLQTQANNEKITKLSSVNSLPSTYVRQCPGYAGYVPRSPLVVPKPVNILAAPNLRMTTTMQASYRPIPLNGTMKHAHKGPLSCTVTLTFPYNPYNKVENRAFFRKDIEHPW